MYIVYYRGAMTDRMHCRGNLTLALELYRKAETYVPENIKLKERWILFVINDLLYKLSSQKR